MDIKWITIRDLGEKKRKYKYLEHVRRKPEITHLECD
jgi:hypothetical protein